MGAVEMREREMIKSTSRQSQNDIKKLRRENEQLRREIWSLRDEYDKLEEILKKQKSREESDEPEVCSETEIAGSEYSEDEEDEEEEEEDDDDDEEESESDDEEGHDKEVRQENAENQKISSEKSSGVTATQQQHRTLTVVHEEEEPKREKDRPFVATVSVEPVAIGVMQQPAFPYHTTSFEQPYPITTTSFNYPVDSSPFTFPLAANVDSSMLMSSYPQAHHHHHHHQQQQQPAAVTQTSSFDVGIFENPHVATPPPPPGWQSSLSARSSPLNFATGLPRTQSPLSDAAPTLKPPEEFRAVENGQQQQQRAKSLAERRKAFFKQYADSQRASGSRDNSSSLQQSANKASADPVGRDGRLERSIDTVDGRVDAMTSSDSGSRTKHFFAPLPAKCRSPCNGEAIILMDDVTMACCSSSLSDNGNSPSSEKTGSTVISRGRYERDASFDIAVNDGNVSRNDGHNRQQHIVSFFGDDNLRVVADNNNTGQSGFLADSNNLLTKSLSCQDLNSRLSFAENLSSRNEQLAKSDSTLDNVSIKAFKSQLNVTLRQPGSRKSLSPDTPEIPKLPSIDYKLFNNPFLQNFEQAYQNFPMRTEGQSPLSLQVCETAVSGAGYSSPVRMQPTFTSPNEADYAAACKRKDLERLRLMIPSNNSSNKLFDGDGQEYQVTSFENPSPHTLQIPPMTPYELEALRRMPTGTTPLAQSPLAQTPRLYQNVPFTPPGMRHEAAAKISTMTQTSPEDQPRDSAACAAEVEQPRKRRSRKDKSGSTKRRSPSAQRRSKDGLKQLKKQSSVASCAAAKDIPETPPRSQRGADSEQDKNESRSSSSGQESPRKEQTKRVSLYFSARKRPSLASRTSTRSRSVENNSRHLGRSDNRLLEGDPPGRERTNSISSREARDKQQRRSSTSSGSVPWCACWGNGCI